MCSTSYLSPVLALRATTALHSRPIDHHRGDDSACLSFAALAPLLPLCWGSCSSPPRGAPCHISMGMCWSISSSAGPAALGTIPISRAGSQVRRHASIHPGSAPPPRAPSQ